MKFDKNYDIRNIFNNIRSSSSFHGYLNFLRIVTITILATIQKFVIIKPSGPEQSTVYVFQALIVIAMFESLPVVFRSVEKVSSILH